MLQEPCDKLCEDTLNLHQAILSLREELEAVDFYRQRADNCNNMELKKILEHNMREEIEHAAMLLEWIRRNNDDFDKEFNNILFKKGLVSGHHG